MQNNKEKSTVQLSMRNGNNKILNDCLTEQTSWISLTIQNGFKKVCEVSMSLTQFASLLTTNSTVPCTIEMAFQSDGTMLKDNPSKPETVAERLSENLNKNQESLLNRINDLEKNVFDFINGNKKASKKELEQLLREIQIVKSHQKSNADFYMKEAKHELEKIHEEKKTQLIHSLLNNDETTKEILMNLMPDKKMIESPKEETPQIDSYEKKQRVLKNTKDMTIMELAEEINFYLKKEEANPTLNEKNKLFYPSASSSKKTVDVIYVSFQGKHKLTKDEASKYLEYLRNNPFKRHFKKI